MKCEEAQEIMIEYSDQLLPEVTKRRVDQHLASCASCKKEYDDWMESSKWIRMDKEQSAPVVSTKSIVDAVMARILSEEKWAIPIGKKVFTLTARMRRIGASAAVILLMLCGFTIFANSGQDANIANADYSGQSKTEVVSSAITTSDGIAEVSSEPMIDSATASAAQPMPAPVIDNAATPVSGGPNYSIILSFFGILITVIAMSWMMRA
ncbi:anti-sigma factor family protein [Brevibacillus ginsengisoli]|uniref:anti-sigma factor family protein n=1 Tax=Brevibacillus ginsengisoli TaxID=363854 RepID=UPI003CEDD4F3